MRVRASARLVVVLVLVAVGDAAALPAGGLAETVGLPGDAATGTSANALIYQVACPAAGDCIGVGAYTDVHGNHQALIDSESGGSWSSQEIPDASLPSAAADGTPPPVPYLTSVACTAIEDCVAADAYDDSDDHEQGLIDVESGGAWTPLEAPLTGVAPVFSNPGVEVAEMACPALDACVGIGTYVSGTNSYEQGLIETQSAGGWSASEMPWATTEGAAGNPDFYDVACASAGECAAVGYYTDTGGDQQGLLESDSGGQWTASELNLSELGASAGEPAAADPQASVDDVSCPGAGGECTAVGTYEDTAGAYVGFAVDEVGGQWQPAEALSLPADASTTAAGAGDPIQGDLYLNGVACASVGDCTAVGSYDAGAGDDVEAFTVTQSGGGWGSGDELGLPSGTGGAGGASGAPASDPGAALYSVSCQAAGECLAAGTYTGAAGENVVLVAQQASGSWTTAATPLPSQYNASLANEYWASVACAPSGYCAAGGYVADEASGLEDAFMLDAPAAPGEAGADRSGTEATVSWVAPADDGGLPVSGYSVTANDLSDPAAAGPTVTAAAAATSAALSGLVAGDSYSFTVTAQSLLGSGVPATTAAVAGTPSPPDQQPGAGAGTSTSTAAGVGTGTAVGTKTGTAMGAVTRARLAASLRALLRTVRSASALRRLRAGRSCALHYRALEAGRVAFRWYWSEAVARPHRTRRLLFAAGTARATRAGEARTLTIRLTTAGRRLLRGDRRRLPPLTATASFGAGGSEIVIES